MSTQFAPLNPPKPPTKKGSANYRLTRWTRYGRILTRIGYLLVILLGGLLALLALAGIIWSVWLYMHGYQPWEAYAIGITSFLGFAGIWAWKGDEI